MSRKPIDYRYLPIRIFPRYDPLPIILYLCANILSIIFSYSILTRKIDLNLESLTFIAYILVIDLTTLYFDIDFIHCILKKQHIEITKEYIEIKKLRTSKKLYWRDVDEIEKLYTKGDLLMGVKLKHVNNKKKRLFFNSNYITINFNKYDCPDRQEFVKFINKVASAGYRMRF